ncbi:MAG: nicotinate-nucleotide diphosphorylase (carboxylating) [Bdellovibrionales bacterium RIFCSPHIGHO2_01_FULL_40_29]|nr:MAG: nicotinate-nucleotide diphosphorylase (carboxylating) [Bdellovibrionales bacterium RIFCSPHIGHO2_01_FULL_40_29]OFZ33829.1 MAG: nicotinate-nucleotide diphosphorylase (carboxylating) [Bdellovibrionales bacterium RIFCSPHIGHO2_02_FULL_40_15]
MTTLDLIKSALKEDMPLGDITTQSLAVKPKYAEAVLKAKEDMVLSGANAFEQTILFLEPNARVKWHFNEGDFIFKGQNLCSIEGDLIQVLKAERVALNFLGRLSGIASLTRQFVKAVQGTKTQILDTRKTTPLLRELEKRAVVHGGGLNHRFNLSDAILIKDNHISLMRGITAAVDRLRQHCDLPIEVEASNIDQVKECVSLQVDRILLDNMNNELLAEALKHIPQNIKTEASGNMNLARVGSVANLGVDFISVGALTHSAPCADVSLLFDWNS